MRRAERKFVSGHNHSLEAVAVVHDRLHLAFPCDPAERHETSTHSKTYLLLDRSSYTRAWPPEREGEMSSPSDRYTFLPHRGSTHRCLFAFPHRTSACEETERAEREPEVGEVDEIWYHARTAGTLPLIYVRIQSVARPAQNPKETETKSLLRHMRDRREAVGIKLGCWPCVVLLLCSL